MDYIEFSATIVPLEVGRDILVAELSEIGYESFVETEQGLEAYIQSSFFNDNDIKKLRIIKNSEFSITYSTKTIKDQNWNETWEKSFTPIHVENRCYIRANFHKKITNIEFDIIIDPKMSFGTGHHETTYLMIKRLLEIDVTNKKVLDMGCGTGVLAILAQLKKAQYVEAIDIDEWAYQNTLENIRNNNCMEIVVKQGGAELLIDTNFDAILANINRNILLNDMNKYANVLSKGGNLLLSGFFNVDKNLLLAEASKLGLELTYCEEKKEWLMLHLIKK
ncbi:MAG: 50S ribosomal protein L11 methyltransferase [Flavobacteriales bacterium CG_4_10_14_0_2_um_filter_32_8]|nr:MAG: 50S ribosomal protein L11 methyltransferase [Flavobacteriales bacterium CG_4_10_14_0_2_um_filter_32_8]PJB15868.1 MAG: 50S ribosomal protein L11 methyltransferase [Flavobacteriales bacterium CG_4_9_14_3_um_filter_32_8]